MSKLTRRESRETAFALLFEWSFKEDSLDEIIENATATRDIIVDSFARELADKVIENKNELDGLIEQYSQGWKLARISKTALAVLRMSFCELTKFGNIPVGASINEAVELVKKFGTDEEAAYLNGILGNFEKVRKGLKEAPPLPKMEEKPQETAEVIFEDMQSIESYEQQVHQEQYREKQLLSLEDDEVKIVTDIIIEVD